MSVSEFLTTRSVEMNRTYRTDRTYGTDIEEEDDCALQLCRFVIFLSKDQRQKDPWSNQAEGHCHDN
jgi:hypothetical protein